MADWITITAAALAKPVELATLYVLHARTGPEDAPIFLARNAARFLRQSVPL